MSYRPSSAAPRNRGAAIVIALLLVALTAGACAAPAPTPTPTRLPTATPLPPTATAVPSPTPVPTAPPTVAPTAAPTKAPGGLPAVHPAGARTGIAGVDAIIAAFLTNKIEDRRPLMRYLTTPCTTAQGGGGPPKCAPGQADGTLVEVFPFSVAEGEFVRRDGIDRILQFDLTGLYGVYRVPATTYRTEYWPAGEHAIVFVRPADPVSSVAPVLQVILYVQEGTVVRLVRTPFVQPWPPAESAGAQWVLAPLP